MNFNVLVRQNNSSKKKECKRKMKKIEPLHDNVSDMVMELEPNDFDENLGSHAHNSSKQI